MADTIDFMKNTTGKIVSRHRQPYLFYLFFVLKGNWSITQLYSTELIYIDLLAMRRSNLPGKGKSFKTGRTTRYSEHFILGFE